MSYVETLALFEIREYTNQYFLTRHHSKVVEVVDGVIVLEEVLPLKKGDYIELLNGRNNGLYTVNTVTDGTLLTVDEDLVDDATPQGVVLILLDVGRLNKRALSTFGNYLANEEHTSVVASQNFGGYSVNYVVDKNEDMYAYPSKYYKPFASLVKLNDDYGEYKKYGYERL